MLTFTLRDAIPSGKNQIGIAYQRGKMIRFPNKRFKDWRNQASKEVLAQVSLHKKPLVGPLVCVADYVPQDQRRRDLPGLADAIWHLLEYTGLIEDDSQIVDLHWHSYKQDIAAPCLKVTLTEKGT